MIAFSGNPYDMGDLLRYFLIPTKLVEPRIWTPDVLCSTCVEQILAESTAIVMHTGEVIWGRYGNYKVLVPFKLEHFPFDEQYFDLNFYPWSLNPPELNLITAEPFLVYDHYSYIDNTVWEITGMSEPTTIY